jgi:hypothetical protein
MFVLYWTPNDQFYQSLDGTTTDPQACLKYISSPTFDPIVKNYKGSFNPPPDLMLEGIDSLARVGYIGIMYWVLPDQPYNSSSRNMSVVQATIGNYYELNWEEYQYCKVSFVRPNGINEFYVCISRVSGAYRSNFFFY